MADTTKISWADSTHNFWIGCDYASLGCKNCYAARWAHQHRRDFSEITPTKDFYRPLHWHTGRRIFTCSLSDFFHPGADPWRDEAWDVIRRTPQHVWLILTKRVDAIADRLPEGWGKYGWPNVWLGASAENQQAANYRIPRLLDIPASLHFVSCEPLLGPIDLSPWLYESVIDDRGDLEFQPVEPGIKWVIAGGESGPSFRQMNVEWATSLRNQCVGLVPFFFKQQAGAKPETNAWLPDHTGR